MDLAVVHQAAADAFASSATVGSSQSSAILGDVIMGATAYSGKDAQSGASIYAISLSFGAKGLVGVCFAMILAMVSSLFGAVIMVSAWKAIQGDVEKHLRQLTSYFRFEKVTPQYNVTPSAPTISTPNDGGDQSAGHSKTDSEESKDPVAETCEQRSNESEGSITPDKWEVVRANELGVE